MFSEIVEEGKPAPSGPCRKLEPARAARLLRWGATVPTVDPLHDGSGNNIGSPVCVQLRDEVEAMAGYALGAGIKLPADLITNVYRARDANDLTELNRLHARLASAVAPAKPSTILLFDREHSDHEWANRFGKVVLVRALSAGSIAFLALFLAFFALTDASATAAQGTEGLLGSSWWPSLQTALLLLSAAGLGASFAALSKVSHYIDSVTYDKSYDGTYWCLIVLGLIAGVILALLIPIDSVAGHQELSKPLLALLGGFSASAVHRILTALLAGLESVFKGDPTERAQAAERDSNAKVTSAVGELRTDVATQVAASIGRLSQGGTDDARRGLERLLGDLLDRPPAAGATGLDGDGSSADVIVLDGHGQRVAENGSAGVVPSGAAGDARPVGGAPASSEPEREEA